MFDANGSPVPASEPAQEGYFTRKFDQGKRDFSLLPFLAVHEVHWHWATEAPKFVQLGPAACLLCATGWLAGYEATGQRELLLGVFSAFNDVEFPELLEEVVYVLEHGAQKYARDSWREVPNALRRYLNAAWRHLAAMGRGEERDRDSGLPHRGHLLCNILFAVELSRDAPP